MFHSAQILPYQAGETMRIATIEADNIIHWEGNPIHNSGVSTSPVVANFVKPVTVKLPADKNPDVRSG